MNTYKLILNCTFISFFVISNHSCTTNKSYISDETSFLEDEIYDPLEPMNRAVLSFNFFIDDVAIRPVIKTYKFIATTDFCNNHPFSIHGSILTNNYSVNNIDDSFNITIPDNANNSDNIIYYWDISNGKHDISNNLYILIDSSNIKYYYDDITIKIDNLYSTDYSNVNISIKSFSNSYNTTNISNIDIFSYDNDNIIFTKTN